MNLERSAVASLAQLLTKALEQRGVVVVNEDFLKLIANHHNRHIAEKTLRGRKKGGNESVGLTTQIAAQLTAAYFPACGQSLELTLESVDQPANGRQVVPLIESLELLTRVLQKRFVYGIRGWHPALANTALFECGCRILEGERRGAVAS